MKIYSVYIKNLEKVEDAVFVKQGLSLFAPIFNVLWAVYNKMWFLSIILLAIKISLYLLKANGAVSEYIYMILSVTFVLTLLVCGNDMKEFFLKKQGNQYITMVCGENIIDAKNRFFKKYVKSLKL